MVPGVLSMAADCAAFARAIRALYGPHHRAPGTSGPQGDDYSIVKECEDVPALHAETGAALLVGHSCRGLVALALFRPVR